MKLLAKVFDVPNGDFRSHEIAKFLARDTNQVISSSEFGTSTKFFLTLRIGGGGDCVL